MQNTCYLDNVMNTNHIGISVKIKSVIAIPILFSLKFIHIEYPKTIIKKSMIQNKIFSSNPIIDSPKIRAIF